MMSPRDPIERLRETFDAITPRATSLERWRAAMDAARIRAAAGPTRFDSSDAEPLPWRLLAGSAIAASVALAVLFPNVVRLFDDDRATRPLLAPVADSVMAAAEPALDREMPSDRPTMLDVHMPATGVNWRMHWEAITSAFVAPFLSDDSSSTGT